MKNFKKVLALVLVVATLFSFATIASAAVKTREVYGDATTIASEYGEAIDVLTAIGVLDGKGANFAPKDTLKRSEGAKLIAMFDNGDAEISSLYASANPFTDVAANHWAVSYIAYCYKVGIIAGVSATKFAPDARLTGIQFLKMVLCVLGFDAHEEGLVGNSWKVNTLKLAKDVGLLDVLGNGFNYDAELTRECAAQIMLNALNTSEVKYGSAVMNNQVNTFYTVNGAVATNVPMYTRWKDLRKVDNYTDAFYRPAHVWLFKDYEIGTYTDVPDAVYTTAVAGCDIIRDCNLNNTLTRTFQRYENGEAKGAYTVADNTVANLGAAGQLTEVYLDAGRIINIDTYLAKVTAVYPERVDANGHLYRDAYVTANAYGMTGTKFVDCPAKEVTFATTGFVKDQWVLVTYSKRTGFNGVAGENGVQTMTAATNKTGLLKGYSGAVGAWETFVVNDETLTVANKCFYNFHADPAFVGGNPAATSLNKYLGTDVMVFMDTYGNVIGLDRNWQALNYATIDAMWVESVGGKFTIKANLVTIAGEKLNGVTVDCIYADFDSEIHEARGIYEWTAGRILEVLGDIAYSTGYGVIGTLPYADSRAYAMFYNRLGLYTVDAATGNYQLRTTMKDDPEMRDQYGDIVDATQNPNFGEGKSFEFSAGGSWCRIRNSVNNYTTLFQMDANTLILVKNETITYASELENGYTAYVGYANIPALSAKNVWYHINADTKYADVVFVCDSSVVGAKATFFYAGDAITPASFTTNAKGNQVFTYNVKLWKLEPTTGALTQVNATTSLEKTGSTIPNVNEIGLTRTGLFIGYINEKNEISIDKDASEELDYKWVVRQKVGVNGLILMRDDPNYDTPNAKVYDTANGTLSASKYYTDIAGNSYAEPVTDFDTDIVVGDKVFAYCDTTSVPGSEIYTVVTALDEVQVYVKLWDEATSQYKDVTPGTEASYVTYTKQFYKHDWEPMTIAPAAGYYLDFVKFNDTEYLNPAADGRYYCPTTLPTGKPGAGDHIEICLDNNYPAQGYKLYEGYIGTMYIGSTDIYDHGYIGLNGNSLTVKQLKDAITYGGALPAACTMTVYSTYAGYVQTPVVDDAPVYEGYTLVVTNINGDYSEYTIVNTYNAD